MVPYSESSPRSRRRSAATAIEAGSPRTEPGCSVSTPPTGLICATSCAWVPPMRRCWISFAGCGPGAAIGGPRTAPPRRGAPRSMASRACAPTRIVKCTREGAEVALHVALIEPQIPPNTGNIARLCAATDSSLHLIGELGFSLDDRDLRRAGLDYWEHVDIWNHPEWREFRNAISRDRCLYFSARAENSLWDAV